MTAQRSLLFLSNQEESLNLLQGIVTNDMQSSDTSVYTLMLNHKGKIDFEFFVIKVDGGLYIDIDSSDVNALESKINMYKLRRNITCEIKDNLSVISDFEIKDKSSALITFEDNRHKDMPVRYIVKNNGSALNLSDQYTANRYKLCIPEIQEIEKSKSMPLEYGFDELGAICYSKGCYLGQELTHSMKIKLPIRKRITYGSIDESITVDNHCDVLVGNERAGYIVGQFQGFIMAKVMLVKVLNKECTVNGSKLQLSLPDWATLYVIE